jgi:adenylate cyclase
MLGDYDKSIEFSQKAIQKYPTGPYIRSLMAMSYALKGDAAKSRAMAAEVRRIAPNFKLSDLSRPTSSFPEASKEYWDRKFVPAWKLAGLPE